MGEAREIMDRLTEAVLGTKDLKAAADCYAADVVAVTPDKGELRGVDQVTEYMRQLIDAFPDVRYEHLHSHESGNTALDEGFMVGTNTAPLPMPDGSTIPATGKQIRMRGCDAITVEGGRVTEHRLYFDQMDMLGQLGLLPEMPSQGQ